MHQADNFLIPHKHYYRHNKHTREQNVHISLKWHLTESHNFSIFAYTKDMKSIL